MYIIPEGYSWDWNKHESNLKKHGLGFDDAVKIFDNAVLTFPDTRDYGELRHISIGMIDGLVIIAVVHTERDGLRRIISARRANRTERGEYYAIIERGA